MNKKYLDEKIRKIVKQKEKWCFTCGSTEGLEVGHFVSRRFLATRWDLDNCHLQCQKCNRFLSGNLKVYAEKLKEIGISPDKLKEKARAGVFKKVQFDLP